MENKITLEEQKEKELMENIQERIVEKEVEELKETMTDDDIEELVKTLHPVTEPIADEETPEHFPYAVINREGMMAKGEALVEIDPETGMHKIIGVANQGNSASFSDIIDGVDQEKMNKPDEETVKNLGDLGLPDDQAMQLYNLMLRYKAGEKFNIYNEFPPAVKDMVHNISNTKNPKVITNLSKGLLEFFINQLNIEQEFIDLQDSIKKELDMPGMVDMYAEHLVESMEIDLLKKADELQESHPEKAEQLRMISNKFTHSYTYDSLHLELDSNPKIVKKINKELKKFNRACRDFNFKYQNSKFKINDVSLLVNTITRQLSCSEEDAKKFVLLFTNVCREMTSDNIIEHTFMYYTIKNILVIDHMEKENEFSKKVLNNIREVINKINILEGEIK